MKNIALVSYADAPAWEVDDRPLFAALEARGVRTSRPDWADPGVDWSSFDAVVVRTTWDYHLRREAFVRWAEAVGRQTRLFNPAPLLRWNTHKRYLRELEAAGIRTIPTAWIDGGEPAPDVGALMAAAGWRRAFLKPQVGLSASDTLRFEDPEQGQAHLAALPGVAMMLQPYLPRVETQGELSAIFLDGTLTHAVQKIPVPGDYRVQDDHGASDRPYALSAEEHDTFQQIHAALARIEALRPHLPLLYVRADLLLWDDDGQLCLTELELVEPSLFFRHAPHAAGFMADALLGRLAAAP